MEFRFVENLPSTGSADTAIEGPPESVAQYRIGIRMPRRGPGVGVQLAIEDLADEVFRQGEDVIIAGGSLGGF